MNIWLKGDIDGLSEGAKLLGYNLTPEGYVVNVEKTGSGLDIEINKKEVCIKYSDKASFFRALTIAAHHLKNNQDSFSLSEKANFTSCGMMLDVSRNGVITVENLKKIVRYMASMGLNQLMLYTEDIYEVEGEPYFGYLRGAYSKKELKEIANYAEDLGVELVPCIQTLAHLAKALRWPAFGHIKDTADILLIDEPKTYEFIEKMIAAMRECFTTNKIHIGMDEAHGVGFGKYFDLHGYKDKFQIMTDHLQRVVEITKKYDFQPMMWSDMFFRLGSKTHDYYELNPKFPDDIKDLIPDEISMVYWDYYNTDPLVYQKMIEEHKKLSEKIVFAGGIWTWGSPSVQYKHTFKSTKAALDACIKGGIGEVFATLWGDDGTECNIFQSLLGMQLFAEYNYAKEYTDEHLDKMFKICTGYDASVFRLFDVDDFEGVKFNDNLHNKYSFFETENRIVVTSKQVLWQDILLGLLDKNFEAIDLKLHYRAILDKLESAPKQEGLEDLFEFHTQFVKVLEQKCDIGIRLRKAYQSNNKAALHEIVGQLENLEKDLDILHRQNTKLWYATYKPFGYETLDARFGALKARVVRARERVEEYLSANVERLEELEAHLLPYNGRNTPFVHDYNSQRLMRV
ncbi:MAG: beta-N-acetylhexosaminidase [Eubacteriales bacterium]|nr:beta-N-acetylhexosaminidase [Eubacteriales bacterium]